MKPECPDICGRVFGFAIEPRTKEEHGTDSPLVHMYIEDDGFWHWQLSFDAFWLSDLEEDIHALKEILAARVKS